LIKGRDWVDPTQLDYVGATDANLICRRANYVGATDADLICRRAKKEAEMEKTLDVVNIPDLKEKVTDIEIIGNPGKWVCICKASSKNEGWMKSTKVMSVKKGDVNYGCLVQVTTQQRNPDGSYSLAEALTYVPEVRLNAFLQD
jgi:hypothetical protein